MLEFNYVGINRSGQKVQGKHAANNEGDLRVYLRGQGIRPSKISRVSMGNQDVGQLLGSLFNAGLRVGQQDIMIFTRQLEVLLSSGVPLLQALELLAAQSPTPSLKTICNQIKTRVSEGETLTRSIALYPKAFSKLYIALVGAGEVSGALDQMLGRLTRYLEDNERIKRTIKGALIYPIMIAIVAILVVAILLYFVIPKFKELLVSNGQKLPAMTEFVVGVSDFFTKNYLPIGALALGVFFSAAWYLKTDSGRRNFDHVMFRMPLFGQVLVKGGTARFCRTMGTLLQSGVNLLDAIDICKMTLEQAVLEEAVAKIKPQLQGGKSLGVTMGGLKIFPLMAVQMVIVGETTGQMDKMFNKIADYYEAEVEAFISAILKMIEPVMIAFFAVIVGGTLIAMYLPVFKMAEGVQ